MSTEPGPRVLVGSRNPVKIGATDEAFRRFFSDVDARGADVDSGVPDQPTGPETFRGARNRASRLRAGSGDEVHDFYVGIEGGLVEVGSTWYACGAICILDRRGRSATGTSPLFQLPEPVTRRLLDGVELGDVIDEITGRPGEKRRGGAIGHYTRGVMNRRQLYVHGIVASLVPFLNQETYFDPDPGRDSE